MFKKISIFLAAVGITLASASCGQSSDAPGAADSSAPVRAPGDLIQPGSLTIGTNFQYAPYEYIDDKGKMAGLDYEVGQLIASSLGLKPKFVSLAHDSLIPAVQTRKVDVAISWIYVSAERAKALDFVDYATSGYGILVKSDSPIDVKAPTDLCGLSIGAGLSTPIIDHVGASGDLGKQCPSGRAITPRPYGADQPLISDLAAGRIDVASGDVAAMLHYAENIPSLKGQIKSGLPQGAMFFPTPVGIGVRKGAPDIQKAVQASVDHLIETGDLPKKLAEYGAGIPDEKLFRTVLDGGKLPLFEGAK